MAEKQYYSMRTGKNPYSQQLDLDMLLRLFGSVYDDFIGRQYFDEAFGYDCVDMDYVPGTLGPDIEGQMFRNLRKAGLWPVAEKLSSYGEDDLFDVVEFLHDHVSKPTGGRLHQFAGCGWHYDTFDRQTGRSEFRSEINRLLCDYGRGYELSKDGEIHELPPEGLGDLLEEELPEYDSENVESRVKAAIRRFRDRHSSLDDRREAVRELADVLEFLRPNLEGVITSKDEGDLFNLANNFGIRHHKLAQKTDYDKPVWYTWMFNYYLATIHAVLRLIAERKEGRAQDE